VTEDAVIAFEENDAPDRLIWTTTRPFDDDVAEFEVTRSELLPFDLKHRDIGVVNATVLGEIGVADDGSGNERSFLARPQTAARFERGFV